MAAVHVAAMATLWTELLRGAGGGGVDASMVVRTRVVEQEGHKRHGLVQGAGHRSFLNIAPTIRR